MYGRPPAFRPSSSMSLYGRGLTLALRHGAPTPTTASQKVGLATGAISTALSQTSGRNYSSLGPSSTRWNGSPVQSLVDPSTGGLTVASLRTASASKGALQAFMDSVMNAVGIKRVSQYTGGSLSDLQHEYHSLYHTPITEDIVRAIAQSSPETLIQMLMDAMATRAVPLSADRQNAMIDQNLATFKTQRWLSNLVTDGDRQQANANFAQRKLESSMVLGLFNMITLSNVQKFTEGNRTYISFLAETNTLHMFRDGNALHMLSVDSATNTLHISVLGAGNSQSCLYQLANVRSATNLWGNRAEVFSLWVSKANGNPLHTIDPESTRASAIQELGTWKVIEYNALRGLDLLSPVVCFFKDPGFAQDYELPTSAMSEATQTLSASAQAQEPAVLDDEVTQLRNESQNEEVLEYFVWSSGDVDVNTSLDEEAGTEKNAPRDTENSSPPADSNNNASDTTASDETTDSSKAETDPTRPVSVDQEAAPADTASNTPDTPNTPGTPDTGEITPSPAESPFPEGGSPEGISEEAARLSTPEMTPTESALPQASAPASLHDIGGQGRE